VSAAICDYYEELGVPESASDADLKSAFRAASLRWHPDRNGGDPEAEERFKRINEAYQVLSDPERRGKYDLERNMPNIGIDWETGSFDPSKINFTEESFVFAFTKIFGEYLDGKAPGVRNRVNQHVKNKKKSKKRYDPSEGMESSSPSKVRCKACKGSGKTLLRQGKTNIVVVCLKCKGKGFINNP